MQNKVRGDFVVCKKCGNEVDIGEVFCQKCGTAIQIVPDYNPLDSEIEVPLEEKNKDSIEQERRKKRRMEQLRKRKRKQVIILTGMAVAIFLICGAGIFLYMEYNKIHSYKYQYNQGMGYYAQKEYGSAIKCFTEALKYDPENIEARLVAADSYSELGDYDRVVELLLEIVNISGQPSYYKKLMEACELTGNTTLMNRILKETQGTVVGDSLAEYRTGELSANIKGGEYHDYLQIILTNSHAGCTIYYTIDGNDPTTTSTVYTEPIPIEKVGSTVLKAVAVNEAGLAGEQLTEIYSISLLVPDSPVIMPDSGTYHYPKEIEVQVPEDGAIYFTLDGSTPEKEHAALYEGPVVMPIGNTIFSAILVDKYGVSSIPAKRNYTCTIDRPFPYDAAVIKLKNYLVSRGIMSDLNGNRGNGERIGVQFVNLVSIANAEGKEEECYIFTLRRTTQEGTTTLGEMIYAVTTENGDVHSLIVKSEGGYAYQPDTR